MILFKKHCCPETVPVCSYPQFPMASMPTYQWSPQAVENVSQNIQTMPLRTQALPARPKG